MNVIESFLVYLGLFFLKIVLALEHILPLDYLGGIVVALFITGLFYAWLNAWRQTKKLIKEDNTEQADLERENTEEETEKEILA
jgi:hypothetical protein